MQRKGKSKSRKKIMKHEKYQSDDSGYQSEKKKDYISLRHQNKKQVVKGVVSQDDSSLLKNYNDKNYQQYIKFLKDMYNDQVPPRDDPQLQDLISFKDNLCFYGYGSKITYLNSIRNKYFSDYFCWQVRGYLPSINIKKIFNNFGIFLKAAGVMRQIVHISMKQQLEQFRNSLKDYSEKNNKPLIIFFHCLDGQNLMAVEHQKSLSELFSLPCIRLYATFDNCRIILLWSPKIKQNFKFLFYRINTNIPSIEEQIIRPNPNQKSDRSQKRLMSIVQSLNGNQKRILKLIAKNQLDNLNKDISYHFTVSQLLQLCIEQVILSSDNQLRENLIQMIDHDVIQQKIEETRAKKVLTMKLDKRLLQNLLNLQID